MFRRILVSIDFSDPSVEALRWSARRFPEAELTAFHAVEEPDPPPYVSRALEGKVSLEQEGELDARTNLEVLLGELELTADIAIRQGWPPAELHRAADEADAGMIVVGAHRRQIWPWDEPPGATAVAIADRARRPVLIWREPPERPAAEETVMAALDLREGSEPVGETAAKVARHFGSRLVLLHVMPGTLQAYLRAVSSPTKVEDAMRSIRASAREEVVAQLPAELRDELEWAAQVARGRPVTHILAAAETEAADLLVVGKAHGARVASQGLLGSVTGKVIRGSNCSVLIVPLAG